MPSWTRGGVPRSTKADIGIDCCCSMKISQPKCKAKTGMDSTWTGACQIMHTWLLLALTRWNMSQNGSFCGCLPSMPANTRPLSCAPAQAARQRGGIHP